MENLELFGRVAGIGGLGLGVVMLVFRDIISKKIFPQLSRQHAYELLRLIIILTFVLALSGLVAWVVSGKIKPPIATWPTKLEDVKTAELIVSDVDDHLIISVNDKELQRVKFGETPGPIPITSHLHRGSNKLSFVVLNGLYGGCGAKVALNLNSINNTEFNWQWFKDIDKACANCMCFTFNKTLYLQ